MNECQHTTTLHAPSRAAMPAGAVVVSEQIAGARGMNAEALARGTQTAYEAIRRRLDQVPSERPLEIVRMWNFVPGITERLHEGLERYMAFNAGRFETMCRWYGGADALPRHAPAASAVSCAGDDAIIHALAVPEPGAAVQNPRQIPAMHYSDRFGPRPPCFARGTRVGDVLLISGTAAITGEESICLGDLHGQLRETILNLRTLVRTAFGLSPEAPAPMRALRAYLPDPSAAGAVEDALRQAFGGTELELVHADLCRSELLVEIEGVAVVQRMDDAE